MFNERHIITRLVLVLIPLLFPLQESVTHAQNNRKETSKKMEIPIYEDAPYKQHIVHRGVEL